MVKKCIVEYDDLGNPIGLIDLKEFADVKSFKDFGELCQKNKVSFIQRQAEAERKAEEEKKLLRAEIQSLETSIIFLTKAVKKLFGVKTAEEIESMVKEVEEHEE